MATRLYKKPRLKDAIMFCGWPGIGNIGITAIDTLRRMLRAEEFGEIEPWDFFNPQKVLIKAGLLKALAFPGNKFYFQRFRNQDLIFFIGDEQPTDGRARYAEGQKAYQMANLVLDVAAKSTCRRVYTSGAAVTQIHHTAKPRVWAVPNSPNLIEEVQAYENTVLMSQIGASRGQGAISGLNGLMLGVARKRGLDAVCLMGEIPYYLQAAPWPYPKASKSVLEVIGKILNLRMDLSELDNLAEAIDGTIEQFLESLYHAEAIPQEVKDEIEKLRYPQPTELGPITDEEKKRIMEHIDELFQEGGWKDERSP
jgi:proteasome assembly chaperone (PAC2) family protein